MNPIEEYSFKLLKIMKEDSDKNKTEVFNNEWLKKESGLEPQDINDAIDYLGDIGALKVVKVMGSAPYDFSEVFLTSRGRFLFYDLSDSTKSETDKDITDEEPFSIMPTKPINPIGTPYGFDEYDWSEVAVNKGDNDTLYSVIGLQFESKYYDKDKLIVNLNDFLSSVVKNYNKKNDKVISLVFEPLEAGLGEHLFNKIARSIIGADIAFFETSDLNPNVMLEMGVALTWGTKVIPIKHKGCSNPPSDISGQTWIEYEDNFEKILDNNFDKKIVEMIKRIILTKS